ncbi:hypothetical protein ZOSMA_175G00450 [Zostera marina]|uniref:Uncharacterized protein n=1 Tax=Zostera marina TaxID=29655 RepID=A0A0K9PU79_ZOSMR|nr:hypothetical protein ZOSMA_175G00450 [Zostera marina]
MYSMILIIILVLLVPILFGFLLSYRL